MFQCIYFEQIQKFLKYYKTAYVQIHLCLHKCMSVVVNVMLSLMSVMSPPPALCNISVRTAVKLCTLGVFALGVILVS